jgi:hypothetical protein
MQRLGRRCIGINASGTRSVPQFIGEALAATAPEDARDRNQLAFAEGTFRNVFRWPLGKSRRTKVEEDIAMRTTMIAAAAAAVVLTAAPSFAGTATSNSTRLAQADVDVRIGPRPGVVIEEPRRPGVVIEEHRRPGLVIEETEGRATRDCVTRSQSETRDGVTVTQKERECAR